MCALAVACGSSAVDTTEVAVAECRSALAREWESRSIVGVQESPLDVVREGDAWNVSGTWTESGAGSEVAPTRFGCRVVADASATPRGMRVVEFESD